MTGPQGSTKKMPKKNRTAIAVSGTQTHTHRHARARTLAVQSHQQSKAAPDIKSTGVKWPGGMTFQSKRERGKKKGGG